MDFSRIQVSNSWTSSLKLAGDDAVVPAASARMTGAGDTVLATLALALAAGASSAEAARLANQAAGIVVGKFGPATVSPAELLDAAADGASSLEF